MPSSRPVQPIRRLYAFVLTAILVVATAATESPAVPHPAAAVTGSIDRAGLPAAWSWLHELWRSGIAAVSLAAEAPNSKTGHAYTGSDPNGNH